MFLALISHRAETDTWLTTATLALHTALSAVIVKAAGLQAISAVVR